MRDFCSNTLQTTRKTCLGRITFINRQGTIIFLSNMTRIKTATSTKPLPQDITENINHFRLCGNPKDYDNNECVICAQNFTLGCVVSMLPCSCKTYYHSECLTRWLQVQAATNTTKVSNVLNCTCPVCRYKLRPSQPQQLHRGTDKNFYAVDEFPCNKSEGAFVVLKQLRKEYQHLRQQQSSQTESINIMNDSDNGFWGHLLDMA